MCAAAENVNVCLFWQSTLSPAKSPGRGKGNVTVEGMTAKGKRSMNIPLLTEGIGLRMDDFLKVCSTNRYIGLKGGGYSVRIVHARYCVILYLLIQFYKTLHKNKCICIIDYFVIFGLGNSTSSIFHKFWYDLQNSISS